MKKRFFQVVSLTVLAAAIQTVWAQETAPPAPEAPIRFEIARFTVSGNTLLTDAEMQAAVAPFVGKDRDFGDVQRALEALEAVYHNKGYNVVTVELPEQELNGGVVTLKVVQNKIGKINVKGNRFVDSANVRQALPALKEGQTPNIKAVSSQLKLANENPARKVTMKLQSGEKDDEIDANLDVVDEGPWKSTLSLDNTGNSSTGKTHISASLQHANLWGRDHVGSIQYTTTVEKPSKVSVYGAGYHIPLYALGDSLDLYANYSNVDSGTITAGIFSLAVSGRGSVFGGRYTHVLDKNGKFEPRIAYGFEYKAFKNNVLLASDNFGNDVTVHPLSVNYFGNMPTADGEANFSGTLVQNIPGGDKGGSADFTKARVGSKPAYTILRAQAALARTYPSGWQTRSLLNMQWTPYALVPGEQFGAGGGSSVRGFDERQVSTDSGLSGNFELWAPNLCKDDGLWQCRILAFVDAAYAVRNKALPGEFQHTTIASYGLGWRWSYGSSMNMQLDWGHVAKEGETTGTSKNKFHIRLGFAY